MAIVFVTVKTESFTFWVNVYIRVGKPRLVDLGELSVNKVSVNKPSRVENRAGIGVLIIVEITTNNNG